MKPYYKDKQVAIYHGNFLDVVESVDVRADVVIADPPYGETSLAWDRPVKDWWRFLPCDQFWCFGSLRHFLATRFRGWDLVQDVVWEKHNGSNFTADRFRRVHEIVTHWRRSRVPWSEVYHKPQVTHDAKARSVRRNVGPAHTRDVSPSQYDRVDGGPRLMRSVLQVRSCHGEAVHPTQKPVGIVLPLVAYSCPVGGLVLAPFCGSGTTLEAARLCGCRALGVELEERFCEAAARRMSQGVLAFGLP